MIKVNDEPSLVRDPYSKAVLSVNREGLAEYKRRKQVFQEMQDNNKKLTDLYEQVARLAVEMKELRMQILEHRNPKQVTE